MSSLLTSAKHLAQVDITGMWIGKKLFQNSTYEFHYHLGNKSICNLSELLNPKCKSYVIRSQSSHKVCNVCQGLLKNKEMRAKIASHKEKLFNLYHQQVISPQDAIINFITAPENIPTSYSRIKKIFEENFSGFSFDDVISCMAVHGTVSLQGDKVLPVVQGEILS